MNESAGAVNPEETPYNREASAAFKAVERRAFEQYVFELIKGWTSEINRLQRKHSMRDYPIAVREVKLEGEYPDTVIRLRTYEPGRDREGWYTAGLWKDPIFFDQQGKRRQSPEKIAGDILRYARGG